MFAAPTKDSSTTPPAFAMPWRIPGLHRAAVVALTVVPLLLVTACIAPALVVLPFLPKGIERARILIAQLVSWTRSILINSKDSSPGNTERVE